MQESPEKPTLLNAIEKLVNPDVDDIVIFDSHNLTLQCVCDKKCEIRTPWHRLWAFTFHDLKQMRKLCAKIRERRRFLARKGMKRKIALIAPDPTCMGVDEADSGAEVNSAYIKECFDQIIYYKDLLNKVNLTCRGDAKVRRFSIQSEFSQRYCA